MGTPYLAEIRMTSFNFAPRGWALCDGQILPINQNQALFSLLGTTYGGNGQTSFALPDLRGRTPLHTGAGVTLGERAGEEVHTLLVGEVPAHSHSVNAAAAGTSANPAGALWADAGKQAYGAGAPVALAAQSVDATGGSQPHQNMPPFLVVSFVIALQGIYPSRS